MANLFLFGWCFNMVTRRYRLWEKKLSIFLVLSCLLSNYFLQGTIFRYQGKQKYIAKDTGLEDGKDLNGFLAAQQLHRMGPNYSTRSWPWEETIF